VAPGARADVDHRVADAGGARTEDPVARRDADREGVHQDVVVVPGIEVQLAADGRDADRVAVVSDPADDALPEVRGARAFDAPEAQGVEARDRPRAHREDVAQDAADAGRRALERLDERGVVVALDLEDRGEAIADVDRARVLARSLEHVGPGGGQLAEEGTRALVRAVLRPHDREDAELLDGRRTPEGVEDLRPLVPREAVLRRDLGGDRARHQDVDASADRAADDPTAAWIERRSFSPSSPPVARSAAC